MSTSVGQQLRQARETFSLTLDQVAHTTRIRHHYLQAMEADDFGALPSATQARGFLRTYATFLKLDPGPLLSALEGKTSPNSGRTGANASSPLPLASTTPVTGQPPSQNGDERLGENDTSDIFIEVGQKLRHQREMLDLSLDDVERHTHLRRHYLQALESGDLESLPSPVQGRGMLNNYASFLGLNPEPLMLRFAEGLQARLAARQAIQVKAQPARRRRRKPLPASLRRLFSGDILIGGTLAILLVILVMWGVIRIFAMTSQQTPTSTAPSIVEVLLATATASITPTILPPTPTILPTLPLFPTQLLATDAITGQLLPTPKAGVQIYLTIRQRSWIRVIVDGKVELEGRVLPGSAYPFVGESQIEVLTSNGSGVQLNFNGEDLGTMGRIGQIVDRIYTQQGVIEPTPMATPTQLSPTPGPTQTALPSSTAGGASQPTVPPLP
jgi:cytoskeleton protein RodZ